jgi:SAM-dependent methyltransferase
VKLHLGCGRDIRSGWVNIDSVALPGVDHVIDLDDAPVLPFDDDSVTHIEGSHVIEHLHHPLPLMAELWRVAGPGCVAVFRTPYGSSDDADEDPTHVRRVFLQSWDYFAQPNYWRADYGYRGDWQPTVITLRIHPVLNDLSRDEVMAAARFQRNVVREMVARLTAVKPARPPHRDLQQVAEIVLERVREA